MTMAITAESPSQADMHMDTDTGMETETETETATATTILACLDFAVQLFRRNNKPISHQNNGLVSAENNNDDNNKFRLEPSAFCSLLQHLETDPRVSLEHFNVEYDPETRLACFRMTQGRLHAFVTQKFGKLVSDAARTTFPHVDQLFEWPSDFFPPPSESNSLDNGSESPGSLPDPLSYLPRVVAEIAYSSPSTLEELDAKCARYISYTHGKVRAAIAVKIPYDRQNPRDIAGIRLDDCLVAVWAWDVKNGKVKCVMSWASVTRPNANITLRPWHFSDPVSNKRQENRRGRRGGRRAATLGRSRASDIRVPFTEIREILRTSIEFASRGA
ncbi:hypothetical protein CkaCkLH20_01554 [Colletotrichum karsti]|uniref:Uncharacterized protein n=1 Tax=Colletotrichum karsti TaxID=1095194 RepID=A0A9P6IEK1_9PEZI|nr:uncharacterized protein CkaCkLH20_01554 [Colletotrichum karsti]KAF9881404.1 hypothetical protein CkaCkLH20_01554 [Colletotrichum karsti]